MENDQSRLNSSVDAPEAHDLYLPIMNALHRSRINRRSFVYGGAATAMALLAACGGKSSASPTPTVNLAAPAPSAAPNTGAGTPAATSASTASSAATPSAGTTTGQVSLGKLKLITKYVSEVHRHSDQLRYAHPHSLGRLK